MAYNKHTWVAREGTGLNKFTDQNGKVYEFTPTPDEVTQPGTPFSAQWMNEMEEQLEKAAVLNGGTVEGNFSVFNALGELINSGKGPNDFESKNNNIVQFNGDVFSTLSGNKLNLYEVVVGSYVGDGTCTYEDRRVASNDIFLNNARKIVLPFSPSFLIICPSAESYTVAIPTVPNQEYKSGTDYYRYLKDNIFYCSEFIGNSLAQQGANSSGCIYHWIAFA